jgi:hypothetical protein
MDGAILKIKTLKSMACQALIEKGNRTEIMKKRGKPKGLPS